MCQARVGSDQLRQVEEWRAKPVTRNLRMCQAQVGSDRLRQVEVSAETRHSQGFKGVAPLLIWAARSPGQEDQKHSDNCTEQSDAEPRPAARHEAPLDEAGTLTNPDATDQDRESTDDHGDAACDLRRHVVRDRYRVTRNRRSSSRDGSPLPSVLELLNSRLFPSCATVTVRSRP
jgi:hypothetical protein